MKTKLFSETRLWRALLLVCALALVPTSNAQIDIQVGEVEVTVLFNGQPISSTGATCQFRLRVDNVLTPFNHCFPRTLSLAPGAHAFQLTTANGFPMGGAVDLTVTAGAATPLAFDVTNLVGIVTGSLTVNGVPPPSGTFIRLGSPQFLSVGLQSNGSFRFVSLTGAQTADIFISNTIADSFSFEALAAVEADIGTIDIQRGDVEVTTIFNGASISATGATCLFRLRVDNVFTPFNHCFPRTLSLAAGAHELQLTTASGFPIGDPIGLTATAGAATPLPIDVTSLVSVVAGNLTVNGGVPPPGTFIRLRSPENISFGLPSNGSFRFVSLSGARTADIFISNAIADSFSFEALPAVETNVGTINIERGDIEVTAIFNGEPISSTGAFCSLRLRIDGVLTPFNHCVPRTISVAAGAHQFQLTTGGGFPIGDPIELTATAGTNAPLLIDVSELTGIVSGSLTVNGGPPPPGTFIRLGSPQFFSLGLGLDGSFRFVSVVGEHTADVFISNIVVGNFPFEALPGLEIEIGAPIGNTPTGSDVPVTATNPDGSASPVSMTFDNVVESGTTTLSTTSTGPPGGADAPPQFKIGSPPTYFNVTTTAVFDGFVKMCINYSGMTFKGPEENLRMHHFKDGVWSDITETDSITGEAVVDTTNNVICGLTPSFSFFAVFEPNLPPTLTIDAASVTVNEGQPAVNAGTFSDSDPGDEATLAVNIGTLEVSGESWSWSLDTDDGPAQSSLVTVTATDTAGEKTVGSFQLTVNNLAPTGVFTAPASATVGASFNVAITGATDASSADAAAGFLYAFDCGAGFSAPGPASGATCTGSGADVLVQGRVVDKDGGETLYSATVRGTSPPSVFVDSASVAVDEGSVAANAGSFSDPDPGDIVTLSATIGSVVATGPNRWAWSFETGDGPAQSGTVTIVATDLEGKSSSVDFQLEVDNVPPVIDGFAGPGPVAIGAQADLVVDYSDTGSLDTHTCEFSWDDDPSSPTVTSLAGSGSGTGQCAGSFTFGAAGVYSVLVTVTDDDGGSTEQLYEFIVVYDPAAGFVTGGGWIDSPTGAYQADLTLTGKANFGFVAKYKKGQTTPDGQTEFQFKAGDLSFHSSSYQWLVVSGSKAQFKGDGTIDGQGDYGFLLTAQDGDINPAGAGPDKFRIKIWNKSNGDAVVYDNNISAGDDIDSAEPTEIGGGSIVIHNKGKK